MRIARTLAIGLSVIAAGACPAAADARTSSEQLPEQLLKRFPLTPAQTTPVGSLTTRTATDRARTSLGCTRTGHHIRSQSR